MSARTLRAAAALTLSILAGACRARTERADAGAAPAAAAAAPLPGRLALGRAATPAEIARVDTDVDTSGAGLPAGRGTADQGAAVYAAKCASCHGARGEGVGAFPKLVQPMTADSFPWSHGQAGYPKTVGNYWPFATTLYHYVWHSMPYPQPRTLTADETYALVAFLLAENGVVPRTAVMDAKTLPAVRMPARGRFILDDRKGGATFR